MSRVSSWVLTIGRSVGRIVGRFVQAVRNVAGGVAERPTTSVQVAATAAVVVGWEVSWGVFVAGAGWLLMSWVTELTVVRLRLRDGEVS